MENDILASLKDAARYCSEMDIALPTATAVKMRRAGIMPREYKGNGDYAALQKSYWEAVYLAVSSYLASDRRATAYKSAMQQAVVNTFTRAAETGYTDGGGELPWDDDTNEWLTARQEQELTNVAALFVSLKMMRDEGDTDPEDEGYKRADGYLNTLDGVYNQARLFGMKNRMLTFDGDDGAESCKDCQRYKGKRHRASWWVAHDAVPPSGHGLECHPGGRCQHYLVTDDGEQVTI